MRWSSMSRLLVATALLATSGCGGGGSGSGGGQSGGGANFGCDGGCAILKANDEKISALFSIVG